MLRSESSSTPAARRGAGRLAFAYAALALTPLLVLFDSCLALARGWRTGSRLDLAMLILAALVFVGATCLVLFARSRTWLSSRAPQLVVLAVSLALAWLAAELVAGPVLERQQDPVHRRRPGLHIVNHPQPDTMPGVSGISHVTTNSWGVRGTEPPDRAAAYRVLCLGGSTTACTYLDDSETWPQVLMDRLNAGDSTDGQRYWVGNGGLPSLTTADHLRFVRESELMRQLDCLLIQCGVNDWMFCMRGPEPAAPVWSHSRVWRLVRSVRERWVQAGDITVEDAAGSGYVWRRARRQAAPIDDELPPVDDCLAAFEVRLRAIVAECRRQNVRVVFASQPVSWDGRLDEPFRKLLWFGALPGGRYLSIEKMREGMDRFNRRAKTVCNELRVEWIDLASLNGRQDVFYDDCHFTEAGAREVADLTARWFLDHPSQGKSSRP
jgi:lysophospholipase L1-like esterase